METIRRPALLLVTFAAAAIWPVPDRRGGLAAQEWMEVAMLLSRTNSSGSSTFGWCLAVGCMVIDPQDPDVMYAGTGEGYFNGDAIGGAGIYKSFDGGVTWVQLPATGDDFEYYIQAHTFDGNRVIWPAAAPTINQTVVIMP